MFDELHGSCLFFKIDLKSRYHHITMKKYDEWKTTYKTKYGLYKWLVMSFKLTNVPKITNVPRIFIRLINYILRAFIGRFAILYFDDILIYSKGLDEYIDHLRQVLDVLRKEILYHNLKKYDFCMEKIVYLGYVVSTTSIEMDEAKIKVMKEWSTPKMVSEVGSFQGLASFYRRFVKDFSIIVYSLTKIIKKRQ
jgi:hypothetical protein